MNLFNSSSQSKTVYRHPHATKGRSQTTPALNGKKPDPSPVEMTNSQVPSTYDFVMDVVDPLGKLPASKEEYEEFLNQHFGKFSVYELDDDVIESVDIPKGGKNVFKIKITDISSPSCFHIHADTFCDEFMLERLEKSMEEFFSKEFMNDVFKLSERPQSGLLVAVHYTNVQGYSSWKRGFVLGNGSTSYNLLIRLIDYGTDVVHVKETDVRRLPKRFGYLKAQAIRCHLAYLAPPKYRMGGVSFNLENTFTFYQLTQENKDNLVGIFIDDPDAPCAVELEQYQVSNLKGLSIIILTANEATKKAHAIETMNERLVLDKQASLIFPQVDGKHENMAVFKTRIEPFLLLDVPKYVGPSHASTLSGDMF